MLDRHMYIHTVEKPLQCNTCNYKCTTKSDMRVHFRMHTGEKPFSCNICDHKFKRKWSLQNHTVRFHTGENCVQHNICSSDSKVSSLVEIKEEDVKL